MRRYHVTLEVEDRLSDLVEIGTPEPGVDPAVREVLVGTQLEHALGDANFSVRSILVREVEAKPAC